MKVTLRGTESGVTASALLAALRGAAPDAGAAEAPIPPRPAEPDPAPEAAGEPQPASILFDEDDGRLRERVAGDLTRGSTFTIGFSAGRADRVLHRERLERQGALTLHVSYAVSFDGGAAFAPEERMEARAPDAGAVYEATQGIPADAVSLLLYVHVKARLAADPAVELADAYDNPGGAFTNYAFALR